LLQGKQQKALLPSSSYPLINEEGLFYNHFDEN